MHSIHQFIPIVTLIIYLFYEKPFIAFGRSSLGRLITILVIVFYTAFNKLLGAVLSLFAIIFYQVTDTYIETMVSAPAKMDKPTPTPKLMPTPKTTSIDKLPTPIQSRDMPPPIQEPFDGWTPFQET